MFEKTQIPNLIKIRPVGAELFHEEAKTLFSPFCQRA
jgi:hypothetical protein